ncbi:MAG TPA: Rieske (2Fe-2S) protein, partial [Ilumatobacteraceae bacterium]|nr:Rieske (2Fe-2S) protein [Ilumatobacteraceae bacterium]
VVPSAGPPAFLDPELFRLNVITGDEPSIFPDQRSFMGRLAAAGHRGVLAIPGTTIDFTTDSIAVTHPITDAAVEAIFDNKSDYLYQYQADWMPWIADMHRSWNPPSTDLLGTLRAWWEPLLAMAPALRTGIGESCVLHAGDLALIIDFPNGEVREFAGEQHAFRFDVQRELIETIVAQRSVDWSNALFLSLRFRAWRAGAFNEYLYNFFKSLSPERMRRAEAEARSKLDPLRRELAGEIRIGDYIVERLCPHRQADLSVFGEIEDGELVCTLHGWRFDLETGRCLTADDRRLRIRRAEN